jgi:hypothetical protein
LTRSVVAEELMHEAGISVGHVVEATRKLLAG